MIARFQPITGPTVNLREIGAADTDAILRWRSDPSVLRQLFSDRAPTLAEHEAWLYKLRKVDDRIELMIVHRNSNRPVGTIGLSRIDRSQGTAEYGILLGEADMRGQGHAREASELLLADAFQRLSLREIFLNLFADNTAALRLYERLGFRDDPALGGVRVKDRERRTTLHMRLTLENWFQYRETWPLKPGARIRRRLGVHGARPRLSLPGAPRQFERRPRRQRRDTRRRADRCAPP
jgi:diamine N-acetyltransferase